ncbi:MAG: phytanoyl-CoA dioxygenase family protein [Planctomycetes bacterium]|nr:phytanoyl-CoA dioxygenase family protein [Planctomycetota bacterium]
MSEPLPTRRDPLREAFERDGFVGPIEVLSAAEVVEVRDAVAAVIADLARLAPRLYEVERAHAERPDEVVCHFLGGWLVHDRLRRLVFDERVVGPAARALGVETLWLFHDQVFAKPPRHPGVVPWHQDYSYWTRTAPAQHVTVNLMLDDADERSGCLMFVPGSHRWPLLPKLPFDAPLEAVRAHLPASTVFAPVAVPLRAGQATLHHSHTLHGSGPNGSERWRRAAVLNFVGPDVRVADDSAPLLRGADLLPVGAAVRGRYFPQVWPRNEPSPGLDAERP